MPVAKRGESGGRQLAMLGAATVLGVAAMIWLFTQVGGVGSGRDIELNLGDTVFFPGNVDRLSSDIATLGPLLFSDVSGGDRDLYLQHLGDDERQGWSAFAARQGDATRDCSVEWQADDAQFVDACDGTIYPADGTGLPQYPVTIDADGNITIDIRTGTQGS